MIIRLKICCIQTIEEAKMAIAAGASALGFVGKMPSGPGTIPDQLIHDIIKTVPPPIATFLLTSETETSGIIDHLKRTNANTVQIVDQIKYGVYQVIRTSLPNVKIVQVIHVMDESSVDEALECSGSVDALLLDSGNPGLRVKELGGTGRVHDWSLSRKIVEQSKVPVFLAGGLNPGNVKEAIDKVQPFGVDVCNGLRTDGKLDLIKLTHFIKNINICNIKDC
jgi:phosphoribosylanthranilate isomerase